MDIVGGFVVKVMLLINGILKYLGIQIVRHPSRDIRRRIDIIRKKGINKVLDIGANTGIYSQEIRKLGYADEIISFEPLSDAFKMLSKNSSEDLHWQVVNYAVGNFDGETSIHISRNSVSSSILEMLPLHFENEKNSKYINTETIKVCKLDTVFNNFYQAGDRIFVKIDTQGYEKNVLEGAKNSISKITGLQLELSSVPLYKGSPTYLEMIDHISSLGFSLYSLENGFCDSKTGRLLQFDAIFFREDE